MHTRIQKLFKVAANLAEIQNPSDTIFLRQFIPSIPYSTNHNIAAAEKTVFSSGL